MDQFAKLPGEAAKPVLREYNLQRTPRLQEMDRAAAGVYNTPDATLEKDETGRVRVRGLTPEGHRKMGLIKQAMTKRYGAYPGMDDPNAPKPPIQPGMPAFNPYTGQWIKSEE
ncbi:MAG: hypothetical protein ACREJ6_10130 [Candidatus Methylomirabilis sp.]